MTNWTLKGIPNCDTVKKARSFLDSNHIDYEFIDFKKQAPTKDDILDWEKKFGDLPVNKKGTTYRKFKDTYEELSKSEKIKFLIENSSMIKRPILLKNGSAQCFGFDEQEFLKKIS